MSLPFTDVQFFDLFGAYNTRFWPIAATLWVATLAGIVQLVRGRAAPNMLAWLLAAHWAWSGLVYHGVFFTRINPAAWLFAGLFVAQALTFIYLGTGPRRLRFSWRSTPWRFVAGGFLLLSLGYPLLSLLTGHQWPRLPLFAVPCPTTLLTTGMLLTLESRRPRWLFVIPLIWSIVGGSAAIAFGVTADLLLFAGAGCLVVFVTGRPTRRVERDQ